MKGVRGHAVADELGVDIGAAPGREFQFLEDDDARALTHDEAVAILVEGAARARGLVVAGRQGAHGGKATDAHRRDGGLGTAGNHHVGVVALDDFEGVADRMGGGGACGAGGGVRALGAEPDGDLAGREVDDGGGDEERRDAARASFEQRLVLTLDRREPADAGGDEHARPGGDLRRSPSASHRPSRTATPRSRAG